MDPVAALATSVLHALVHDLDACLQECCKVLRRSTSTVRSRCRSTDACAVVQAAQLLPRELADRIDPRQLLQVSRLGVCRHWPSLRSADFAALRAAMRL